MNYYQHHIGDFIRDTSRLTDSQCMAYLRMIWMYYEIEQPLSDDADAIAFRIGANAADVHQILRHFFFLHEGMWHHSRCDKEILAFRGKSEKAKKSADARWNNANAMRAQCERNADEHISDANQEPITNNQEPKVNHKRTPRFDAQSHLIALGAPPLIAADWLTHRKAKKAAVTLTAIDGIEREAAKAGVSIADALALCCQRGWVGFKADWIANNTPPARASPAAVRDQERQEVIDVLTGRKQNNERTVAEAYDGQFRHIA